MIDNSEDLLPVINEKGEVTGTAPRSVCHDGESKLLHPVIHLHVFDPEGRLFLQKRAMSKDIQPGRWDTSVGGHVDPGESVEEALARETIEETGLAGLKPEFITLYIWESEVEREMVHSYYTVTDRIPVTDPTEVSEGRFWTMDEIEASVGKGVFTPNFEHEFPFIESFSPQP